MSEEHNFCFPAKVLENSRLRLVPFDVGQAFRYPRLGPLTLTKNIHGQVSFETTKLTRLWQHMPIGPFADYETIERKVFDRIRDDRGMILFAMLAKESKEGSLQDEDFGWSSGLFEQQCHRCGHGDWIVRYRAPNSQLKYS